MAVVLGAGWELTHATDRVLELRKACPVYRRLTGRDGYVRLRAEPGADRQQLLNQAMETAKRNDAALSDLVARQLLPRNVRRYQMQQRQLASSFGIPGEEPEQGVYRP
jgi:hypothetical protein